MNAFDDRLVMLQITLPGQNGRSPTTYTYDQDFYILASGTKYTNGNFGEFVARVDNISKTARDYLVTRTSLWTPQRTNAIITLSVGRASYGTFVLATGNAIACNPSQPPDIGLTFKSLALAANMGIAGAFAAPAQARLSQICQLVANSIPNPLTGGTGVPLDFEVPQDPLIDNYNFTGPVPNQIKELQHLANINAYYDNSTNILVVRGNGQPRSSSVIQVNRMTGLIGVPEVTEIGARCKMLIQNEVRVGDSVNLQSVMNPAADGTYTIVKLGFDVASRDTPFYWNMDLRAPLSTGAAQ